VLFNKDIGLTRRPSRNNNLAPTSATKPRSSSRSRQAQQAAPAVPATGLYGKPTTINNTLSFATVPAILRKGRMVRRAWRAECRQNGDLLRSGHVKAGQLRAADGHS
jgi:hypothetical protein